MANTRKEQDYINEFIKEKYEPLNLAFDKGMKEILAQRAKKNGESLNAYIVRLIKEDMMERWY